MSLYDVGCTLFEKWSSCQNKSSISSLIQPADELRVLVAVVRSGCKRDRQRELCAWTERVLEKNPNENADKFKAKSYHKKLRISKNSTDESYMNPNLFY